MITDRFHRMSLARGAAVGAVLVGSLVGATTALASPGDALALDHQLTQHLGPSQQALFTFHYGGPGDVAQIVLLPSAGTAAQLSVKVLGIDQSPVELYDGGTDHRGRRGTCSAGRPAPTPSRSPTRTRRRRLTSRSASRRRHWRRPTSPPATPAPRPATAAERVTRASKSRAGFLQRSIARLPPAPSVPGHPLSQVTPCPRSPPAPGRPH